MARTAPPPDFRYVGLSPVPGVRDARLLVLGSGACAFGAGVGMAGAELGALAAAGVAGSLAALLAARVMGPTSTSHALHTSAMAIVPWGVLVQSDPMPRVLRWSAVRSVQVDFVHEMDHATPATRWSVVTIGTDREKLGGRARGGVSLERLEAHFESYAAEAARPIALDLDGQRVPEEPFEPVVDRLLEEAQRLLSEGELRERLQISPASYRHGRATLAFCDTMTALRSSFDEAHDAPADVRPLLCVLAAELSAREVEAQVVALSTSPHPLVAATARAAALRLGVRPLRVGALEELSEFVDSRDLARLSAWVRS